MSYRGRPSKGCDGCRIRKIKCDEGKPACSKCSKTGSDCKYRDQADIFFKNQTASAAQRAESSWRKRSKPQSQVRSASGSRDDPIPDLPQHSDRTPADHTTQQSLHQPSLPDLHLVQMVIAPEPLKDPLNIAYARLLYDFVAPKTPRRAPDEPPDSLFTFIPALYTKTSSGSCLTTIINALAYTNFANRCNAPQMAIVGAEMIGKGIKMLSKIILDRSNVSTNETLCSVYAMTLYENIASIRQLESFNAHQAGATALLQLRSIETFHEDATSAKLYEVSYLQMLIQNLHSGNCPSIPVDSVAEVRRSKQNPYYDSNTRVMELAYKVAVLHAEWYKVKHSDQPPAKRRDMQGLMERAIQIDDEFRVWTAAIPQAWLHHVKPNTPEVQAGYMDLLQKLLLKGNGAPSEVHLHANIKRCWISNFHKTSRIFLLRDMLEMLNWMLRMPESERLPIGSICEQHAATEIHDTSHIEKPHMSLDVKTLCVRHASATNALAETVEAGCAAIISAFTVNITERNVEDISGVRGYITFWTLGTMDAILKAGLIPDATVPISPPPDPVSLAHPQLISTPTFNPSLPKHHVFDSHPKHPYDFPTDLPYVDAECSNVIKIDVVARRAWINRILYYIGSELGVRKALAVWSTEGLNNWKMEVDAILGKT